MEHLLQSENVSQEDKLRMLELITQLGKLEKELKECKSMVTIRDIYTEKLFPAINELAEIEIKALSGN